MRRISAAAGVLLLLVGLACQKEDTEELDQEAIREAVLSSPLFAVNDHYEGGAVSDSGDTTVGQPHQVLWDSIVPLLWGRVITAHPDPDVIIEIHGDSAFVNFEGHNVGFLCIVGWNPDTGAVTVQKPLSETFWFSAVFRRRGTTNDPGRGWELEKITPGIGESDTFHTVSVESVRVECTSYPDTVISDPTEFFDVSNLITLQAGEEVTLTVYTNDSTASVFVHVFRKVWPRHIRLPLEHQGGGVFRNRVPWRVGQLEGPRLLCVDMLGHLTLWSDSAYYDFKGWLIPYQVEGGVQ